MPTYSYRCTACGNAFDIQQSFTDSSLTTCEACGGSLRKLFSAIGVTFNGSGFYRTDSRSKPESAKAESAKAGGSSDSAPGSAGSNGSSGGSSGGASGSSAGSGSSSGGSSSGSSAPASAGAGS